MTAKTMTATRLLELKDKRIQQLEQDKEALKASLSLYQEQNKEMTSMFQHILEYWNKDANHDAMLDALNHIEDVAADMLSEIESQKEGG